MTTTTSTFTEQLSDFQWVFREHSVQRQLLWRQSHHSPSTFAAFTLSHKFNDDWSIKQRVAYKGIDFSANVYTTSGTVSNPANPTVTELGRSRGARRELSRPISISSAISICWARKTRCCSAAISTGRAPARKPLRPSLQPELVSLNFPVEVGLPSNPASLLPTPRSTGRTPRRLYIQDQVELPYGFFAMAGRATKKLRKEHVDNPIELGVCELLHQRAVKRGSRDATLRPAVASAQWMSLYGNLTEGFGTQTDK